MEEGIKGQKLIFMTSMDVIPEKQQEVVVERPAPTLTNGYSNISPPSPTTPAPASDTDAPGSWDYYVKLCHLYVDGGTVALRRTFNLIHPPVSLVERLAKPEVHKTLRRLRIQGVITDKQWEVLYPAIKRHASSANYDPVLLMTLLKSICHLPSPYPNGWDELPLNEDRSMTADLVRLHLYRRALMVLDREGNMEEKQFKVYWKQICDVITRLGADPGIRIASKVERETLDQKSQHEIVHKLHDWHSGSIEASSKEKKIENVAKLRNEDHDLAKITKTNFKTNIVASKPEKEEEPEEAEEEEEHTEEDQEAKPKNRYSKQAQLAREEEEEIIYEVTKSLEKDILESFSQQLIEGLKAEECVPKLVQRGVLSHEEKNKIFLIMRNADRMRLVVELLAKKTGKAFDTFCDIIKFKHKGLYNKLVETKKAPLLIGRPDEGSQVNEALKNKYKAVYNKCMPIPWHDTVYAPIHDFFVHPYITDLTGRDVTDERLFSPYPKREFPRRILIEGTSGVGKTTFCRHLAYEWARGNVTWDDRFKLVFLIDVRMIHKKGKEIEDVILEQCLPFSFKKSRDEITAVLKKLEKHVLFIVDGVESQKQINALSILYADKNPYPEAAVIATINRNFATAQLMQSFDTRLVLMGQHQEQQDFIVKTYCRITQQNRELFDPLLNKIYDERDNVHKVLSLNPVCCLCMCLICEQEGSLDFSTLSFMMQGFISALQRLYCERFNYLVQRDNIPDEVTKNLNILEEIAFNASTSHTDIMQTEPLGKQFKSKDFVNFGLLTVFLAGQRSRPIENCIFTSTMLQDFLAARFLSRMDIDDFMEYTEQLVTDPHMHNIAVFFSGILRFDSHIRSMQELFKCLAQHNLSSNRSISFVDEKTTVSSTSKPASAKTNYTSYSRSTFSSATKNDGRLSDFKLGFECLHECEGREDVMKILLDSLPQKFFLRSRDIPGSRLIGGLCQVIKANTPIVNEIDFRLDHTGQYNIHALRQLAKSIERSAQITTLRLRWTSDSLLAMFLAQIFGKNSSITTLKIYDESKMKADTISATVWSNFWAARSGMKWIRTFAFSLCKNPALTTSILRNTPNSLQELYLHNCSLDLIGAQELAQKCEHSPRLKVLSLQSAEFNHAEFVHIAKGFKHSKSLAELNLAHTGMDQVSMTTLTEALAFNKSIRRLDLSRNVLEAPECHLLANMFSFNKSILEVNLRECGVGEDERDELTQKKRDNVVILGINPRRPASSYYNGAR